MWLPLHILDCSFWCNWHST